MVQLEVVEVNTVSIVKLHDRFYEALSREDLRLQSVDIQLIVCQLAEKFIVKILLLLRLILSKDVAKVFL